MKTMKTLKLFIFILNLIFLVGCNSQDQSVTPQATGNIVLHPVGFTPGYPITINIPVIYYRYNNFLPLAFVSPIQTSIIDLILFSGANDTTSYATCEPIFTSNYATYQACLSPCLPAYQACLTPCPPGIAAYNTCVNNCQPTYFACLNTCAVNNTADHANYLACMAPFDALKAQYTAKINYEKQTFWPNEGTTTLNYLSYCIATASVTTFSLLDCQFIENGKEIKLNFDVTEIDSLPEDLIVFFTYGNFDTFTSFFSPYYLNDEDGNGDYAYFMYYQLTKADIQSGTVPLVQGPIKVYESANLYDFGSSI